MAKACATIASSVPEMTTFVFADLGEGGSGVLPTVNRE
jgi:hypothetical protein